MLSFFPRDALDEILDLIESVSGGFPTYSFFNYQKVDNKTFVCKFSKNVQSKLYHIENSMTRGQTV